jgi:hypothetical protein
MPVHVHPRTAGQDRILPGKGAGRQRQKYRHETHVSTIVTHLSAKPLGQKWGSQSWLRF